MLIRHREKLTVKLMGTVNMTSSLYYSTDRESELIVYWATQGEVDSIHKSQSSNKFSNPKNKMNFSKISFEDFFKLDGEYKDYTFSFSMLSDVPTIDFSWLSSIRWTMIGVQNLAVFENDTIPTFESVEQLVISCDIDKEISLDKFTRLESVNFSKIGKNGRIVCGPPIDSILIVDVRKMPGDGLKFLEGFENCKKFEIYQFRSNNLFGIERFSHLQELRLNMATNIDNIDAISSLTELNFLLMGHIKKLASFQPILKLEKLSELVLAKCKNIPADEIDKLGSIMNSRII